MVSMIPTVLERVNQGNLVGYDIFSRLLKDRIIFVGGYEARSPPIRPTSSIAQLLYLEADDPRRRSTFTSTPPGAW